MLRHPELSAAVAEHVFGCKVVRDYCGCPGMTHGSGPLGRLEFAHTWEGMGLLLEHLIGQGHAVRLHVENGKAFAWVQPVASFSAFNVWAQGATLPEVVARAALMEYGHDELAETLGREKADE